VNCEYKSIAGMIKSSWKLDGKTFILNIEVPVDSEIYLPDGTIHKSKVGMHEFSCNLN
jgi:hypothetical protein